MKLQTRNVEKPWGRTDLPPPFEVTDGKRIGEIWFASPERPDLPMLAKYIFTSEKLSIQVHPSDEEARARGLPKGKNECWLILDAEPGALLGLGLKQAVDGEALRAAALDGSIEEMMDWKPVQAGDFFYVPSGTVHAIGAGITLLEFQQNVDLTYRLYDYGRPRELHLDDGVAVSRAEPYPANLSSQVTGGDQALVTGPLFTLLRVEGEGEDAERLLERDRWVMPLKGVARSGGDEAGAGECLFLPAGEPFTRSEGSVVMVGAAGPL